MKKIFTLIAVLAMVINASADDWKAPAVGSVASGTVLLSSSDVEITSKYDVQSTSWKDEADSDCPRVIGDVKYTTYVPLRAATAPSMFAPAGAQNTGACVVMVKAINNVDVTFTYRRQAKDNAYVAGDGKDILCYNQVTKSSFVGTLTQLESTPAEADGYMHCSETFKLVAGVSYTFYAIGTTLCLEGISTAVGTTTETTPTSATALPSDATVVWNCSDEATTDGATIGDLSFKFIENSDISWSFAKYASPSANPNATGGSIEFSATKSGRLFIMFAGSISTTKTLNIDPALSATVISTGAIIENAAKPAVQIASGDGIYYDIAADQKYTFFVGGTKYRVSTIAFDNAAATGINNIAVATTSAKAKKYMQNGQLVIETANGTFNVAGARVK